MWRRDATVQCSTVQWLNSTQYSSPQQWLLTRRRSYRHAAGPSVSCQQAVRKFLWIPRPPVSPNPEAIDNRSVIASAAWPRIAATSHHQVRAGPHHGRNIYYDFYCSPAESLKISNNTSVTKGFKFRVSSPNILQSLAYTYTLNTHWAFTTINTFFSAPSCDQLACARPGRDGQWSWRDQLQSCDVKSERYK